MVLSPLGMAGARPNGLWHLGVFWGLAQLILEINGEESIRVHDSYK